MIRRPPRSTRTDTLFPYTTLFRSVLRRLAQRGGTDDADLELNAVQLGAGIRYQADTAVQPTGIGAVVFHHHPCLGIGGRKDALADREPYTPDAVLGKQRKPVAGPLNPTDRKSTRLNSSHSCAYRMPSSA